jgi:signal transduction histidine kinase
LVNRQLAGLPAPWPRLGLRARITLAFTVSAALLSTLLASSTFAVTRENLINQRESTVTGQAFANAKEMRQSIGPPNQEDNPAAVTERLSSLLTPTDSLPAILLDDGSWIAVQTTLTMDAVPRELREEVASGRPASMRYELDGEPQLAVGMPLRSDSGSTASYFEVASLEELSGTLESLATALFGGSLVTTLAGAVLGWWTSRRTLRPLANVSVAAEAIAGGRLDTRLEAIGDPDLSKLVSSFNHMAQALEKRIELDGRFASDVSHELRSPLMTLSASLDVLASRRDDMPDDASQAAVDLMVADVGRFRQLVEDLLEISRFDAGVARLSLDEVLLGELVRQSVAMSHEYESVEVIVPTDLEDLVVRVDKRRMVRVIANLLDNARKYGGGATSVSVRPTGDTVQIGVEDAGPGVPQEERRVVFDRFSRGLGAGRRTGADGVGLGLSLVSEHIALHGGRVWVEDRLDSLPGARFVIELPKGRAT